MQHLVKKLYFSASEPIPVEESVSVAKPVGETSIETLPSGTDFDCPEAGTFPSPLDCVTYYQCTSDGKYWIKDILF